MLRTLVTILLCGAALFAAPTLKQMQDEHRIALVIANADYANSPLPQARAKAAAMRAFLERTGFEVLYAENADKRTFISLLREFALKVRNGSTALFYYYGHAIQNDGKNYLIPYEAAIFDSRSVRYQAIDLDSVFGKLLKMPSRAHIMVLDTAFGNPFKGVYTPSKSGLAPLKQMKKGSYFIAEQPGHVQRESALTDNFIKVMGTPGMSLEQGKRYLETTTKTPRKPLIIVDPSAPFYFILPDTLSADIPAEPAPQRSFG